MLIRSSLLALDQAARLQFNIGDGLDLWLDDRRLGARQDDRDISIRLTGEVVPEDVVAIHVRGQIGSVPIELRYDPEANLVFKHVWDGTSAEPNVPGTPASVVTQIAIGWEMAEQFPRPSRIKWWHKDVVAGGVDLRSLGCGGISPDAVHHLDVSTDTLWRGNGSRLANARAQQSRHLSRLKIAKREIGVADGYFAHVFDRNGNFKRTLSMDKGHEIASARTDELGHVTSWTRAGHRYTIDRRNDSEAMLRSPAGVWAVIDFDDRGRAAIVTDQDKSKATLEYTSTGGLARVVDSSGLVSEFERDDLGRVTSFADSTGRRMDLVRVESPTATEVTVITAEGRETTHRSERLDDGTYVESHSCCGATSPRRVEHRSLGPLGTEQVVTSPTGMITTTQRSSRSDKVSAVEAERTVIATPAGRTLTVNRRTERRRSGRTDEFMTVGESLSAKRLDPEHHQVLSRSAAGREATTTLVPGESLSIVDSANGAMLIEFDPNGRPRRRDRQGEILTFGYDQNGRLTWVDFERWRQHIHHDEQGRVIAIETPDGWVQIARDAAGRVVAVQSPGESATSLRRRADGLLALVVYPEVAGVRDSEELVYDRDGLLIAQLFSNEHQVVFERDLAGRVSTVTAPDVKLTSTYNEATGQLSEINSAEGDSISFEYDGDLEWAETAGGRSTGRIERAFDNNHRVIARRINGAHDLHYERDADGLVTAVGPLQIDRSTKAGLPLGVRLGGLTTTQEFDDSGRLARHETRFGRMAKIFFGEEIERDDFGRVAKIRETTAAGERLIEYTYSETRRLESVHVNGTNVMALAYDANGNIASLDRMGRTLELNVDAADRLIAVAGQPTSHDDAGNLTGIGIDGAVRSYRFDGLSRFVSSVDTKHDVTHALDPIGRPVRVTGAGSPHRYLWDGDRLAAILDSTGNVDVRFIDSGTQVAPEAAIRAGVEYLFVKDHLGSVRMVVNAQDGTIVQTLNYDALGRSTSNTAVWQPFGFAGGLHEMVGGLVRFGTRTYDPFIGRFLSRDPLGFAGGQVNLYQYALGDPVNNIDPTGMLVGPSGEINPTVNDFLGSRPLSADHVYMKMREWTDSMEPRTTLGDMGRLLSHWTRRSTFVDQPCSDLVSGEASCRAEAHRLREGAPTWTQTDECFGVEWSALDIAATPAAWQFDPTAWDEGPGLAETKERLNRLPLSIRRFRSEFKDNVATFVDGLFD